MNPSLFDVVYARAACYGYQIEIRGDNSNALWGFIRLPNGHPWLAICTRVLDALDETCEVEFEVACGGPFRHDHGLARYIRTIGHSEEDEEYWLGIEEASDFKIRLYPPTERELTRLRLRLKRLCRIVGALDERQTAKHYARLAKFRDRDLRHLLLRNPAVPTNIKASLTRSDIPSTS